MIILRNIITIIYLVLSLTLIVVATMQTKDSDGASGTITGSSTSNFYEKNRGRTREGKLKRLTIILSVLFVVLSVALGIMYVVIK